MSQTYLYLAILLLGLSTCFAVGPRERPVLCCAFAFPVGLTIVVLLTLAIVLTGIPYTPITMSVAMAIVGLAALIGWLRRGVDRRELVAGGWWTAAFAALCPALTYFNVAIMSYDSFQLVMLGHIIAVDGGLSADVTARLNEWGVFQVFAQSTYMLTPQDYLYSLPVVTGVSLIAAFAVSLWHGLDALGGARRYRAPLVALVTATLFTIFMVDYHLIYIHTNLPSALYLFGFVVLFWLAELKQDPSTIPVAFICLIGFALQRVETPLVSLIFLSLALARTDLPRRKITPWFAAFTAVVGLWYEFLAQHLTNQDVFLTPMRCRLFWGALLVVFLWWLASRNDRVRHLNRFVPAAIVILCVVGLAVAFGAKPDHMFTSAKSWFANLTELPYWGQSWYWILALILLAALVEPPRFHRIFVVGVPVFFGLILLLSALRQPYRLNVGDSANRMTLHVMPLIFFYLGLKLIPILSPEGRLRRSQTLPATGVGARRPIPD